jgi:hypothetical protein
MSDFFSFESDDTVDTYSLAWEIIRELDLDQIFGEETHLNMVNRVKSILDARNLKCR